jgi:hypothetical protein
VGFWMKPLGMNKHPRIMEAATANPRDLELIWNYFLVAWTKSVELVVAVRYKNSRIAGKKMVVRE